MRLLNLMEQIIPGSVTYITRNRHYRWGCSMLAVPCLWLGSGQHVPCQTHSSKTNSDLWVER